MPGVVNESEECGNCSFVFESDGLGQESRERKPCPNCGSLRRHIRLSVKETLGLNEYIGVKAKKPSSKHKRNRADYEFGEGKRIGKDGRLVYKKRVINREHPDLPGSYVEVVKDKDGKFIVNKSEKLSEHRG
jgi:hypothetical protein